MSTMNIQATEAAVFPIPPKLSERHLAILRFVYQYTQQFGYAPNIREMGSAIGITSTSLVNYYLSHLTRKHYIQRTAGTSRSVLLLEAGYLAIGQPMPDELQTEIVRLLVENRRLREQCEQLQRERDGLLAAPASS